MPNILGFCPPHVFNCNHLERPPSFSKLLYCNHFTVQNNFQRQRKNYEGIEIPFSYSDYKEVLQNSYFTTNNGERERITSLVWSLGADTAQIDFYIEEIYTRNLKEEFQ